jgi:hypothetical protein
MVTERHHELLTALYVGKAPAWLPEANRPLFERESLRRRTDLCQTVQQHWPCTAFLARSALGDDFLCEAFGRFPETRHRAGNIVTAVYLSLEAALRGCGAALELRELFRFESLAVPDLLCDLSEAQMLPDAIRAAAGLAPGAVVHRFETAVAATHARLRMYASAAAPASFARQFRALRQVSYMAQRPQALDGGVEDVTAAVELALEEKEICRA